MPAKMKTRGALQQLQASANDKDFLVRSPKVTVEKNAESKDKFKVPMPVDKENVVRRSKRKGGEYSDSVKNPKNAKKNSLKQTKPKKEKLSSIPVKESLGNRSIPSGSPNPSVTSEESVEFGNVTAHRSFSEAHSMIHSDLPPKSYCCELAEQRRITLEKTLHENEQLYDQITVLQTELGMYKSALEAAEKLIEMNGLLD